MKRKHRSRNCMGYALNRQAWMLPKGYDDFAEGTLDEDQLIWDLEQQFKMKRVTRDQMVRGKEYVAFRYEADVEEQDEWDDIIIKQAGDFHFMKRHKTGHWTHKLGGTGIYGIGERKVFSPLWKNGPYTYNSDIILFEVLKANV